MGVGKIEGKDLGRGVVFESHLQGSGLAKSDAVAVAVSSEMKRAVGYCDPIEVAANAIPPERTVDGKVQAAGGEGCCAGGTGDFK